MMTTITDSNVRFLLVHVRMCLNAQCCAVQNYLNNLKVMVFAPIDCDATLC